MATIQQLAAERRSHKETATPPATGHPGVCTGVYEIGNGKRRVARVRLSTGAEVTAYLSETAPVPEVGTSVLVNDGRTADQPPARHSVAADQSDIRHSLLADQPPARHSIVADQTSVRHSIAADAPTVRHSLLADR